MHKATQLPAAVFSPPNWERPMAVPCFWLIMDQLAVWWKEKLPFCMLLNNFIWLKMVAFEILCHVSERLSWMCFLVNLVIRLSDPRTWTAHLGMRTQGKAKFTSTLRRIIVHEYYNSRNFDYDIALLQLSRPWLDTMRRLIQPICIPPTTHRAHTGEKCWVTGWGQKQEAGELGWLVGWLYMPCIW